MWFTYGNTWRSATPKRLDATGTVRSGRKGDSLDNAAAESLIGLYKTQVTRRRSSWQGSTT
jgi:putative transposase